MSKTPRTDEQAGALIDAEEVVPADFARELERENAALRALLIRIRNEKDLLKIRPGAQDQYAGMPPMYRLIDAALAKNP